MGLSSLDGWMDGWMNGWIHYIVKNEIFFGSAFLCVFSRYFSMKARAILGVLQVPSSLTCSPKSSQ